MALKRILPTKEILTHREQNNVSNSVKPKSQRVVELTHTFKNYEYEVGDVLIIRKQSHASDYDRDIAAKYDIDYTTPLTVETIKTDSNSPTCVFQVVTFKEIPNEPHIAYLFKPYKE